MLVRRSRIIWFVRKVEDHSGLSANRLVSVKDAWRYEEGDGRAVADDAMPHRTARGRLHPSVIERQQDTTLEYNDHISLAVVPMPTSHNARSIDRDHRLTEANELWPVRTKDFRERASRIAMHRQFPQRNAFDWNSHGFGLLAPHSATRRPARKSVSIDSPQSAQ